MKQLYPGISVKGIADTLRAMAMDVGKPGTDSAFGAGLLYVFLPPPVLLAPANGSSGLQPSLTLSWSTVANALKYDVQVSTDPGFSSLFFEDANVTAGSRAISGLVKGTPYYWRVRSENSHGNSAWSSVWKFTIIRQFALSVTSVNGSVAFSPNAGPYDSGTVVTLTETPSPGYLFTGWSGDASGTSNPVTVTMNSAKSVTANFTIKQFALSVTAVNGTVSISPNRSLYDSGTVVTLTAAPSPGYVFTGWGGDAGGTATAVTVTMNSAKNVTANFTIKQFALSVTAVNGTVSISPNRSLYDSGTVVTLTAAPSPGYVFTGWGGDASGTATLVTVTMNSAKSVTANFTIKQFALAVTATNGTVALSPNRSLYDSGTVVTLTANPSPGYVFSTWSGDASGTSNPTTVTMNSAKNVTANFTIKRFAISVTAVNGTVSISPNQSLYDSGSIVTLTATPSAGYVFSGWSGGAGGTSNPVAVTMISDKSVTANFAIKQFSLSVTAQNGTVTKSPDLAVYDSGTVVSLTPQPSTGYHFSNWAGDITGSAGSAIVTMNSAKAIAAVFAINVYSVTASSAGNGAVRPSGSVNVNYGDTLRDSAAPNPGYNFAGWNVSGGVAAVAGGAAGKFLVTGTGTVQAVFSINTYALLITAANGTVVKSPNLAT